MATLAATLGSSVVLARAPHAKITLTIWSPENRPADAQAHAWLISKFEAAHPDIAVRVTTTTWDDHMTRVQAAKAAVFSRRLYGVCGRPVRRWADNWALLEPSLDSVAIHRPWAAVACRQATPQRSGASL